MLLLLLLVVIDSHNVLRTLLASLSCLALSEIMCCGTPRLAANFRNDIKKASVDILGTTSRCTALVVRHVNNITHPFTVPLSVFILIGPKQSSPVIANGRVSVSLSSGNGANCSILNGPPWKRLQTGHFQRTRLTVSRPLVIQKVSSPHLTCDLLRCVRVAQECQV